MAGSQNRPVFTRPIEIDSSNDSVQLTHSSGAYVITLTNGVYGCVNSALWTLNNIIQNTAVTGGGGAVFGDAPYSFALSIDADGRVNMSAGQDMALTWIDPDMAAWIGFETDVASSTSATADWTPSHMWLPLLETTDQNRWELLQGLRFAGVRSNSGRLSGSTVQERRYARQFTFAHELAENVYINAENDPYTLYASTYQPQADRSYEYFVEQSRIATSTGTNAYSKGIYLWHSLTNFRTLTQTLGDGGIQPDLSSGDDKYVFCSLAPDGDEPLGASLPVGRTRYNVRLRVQTADAPTWDVN